MNEYSPGCINRIRFFNLANHVAEINGENSITLFHLLVTLVVLDVFASNVDTDSEDENQQNADRALSGLNFCDQKIFYVPIAASAQDCLRSLDIKLPDFNTISQQVYSGEQRTTFPVCSATTEIMDLTSKLEKILQSLDGNDESGWLSCLATTAAFSRDEKIVALLQACNVTAQEIASSFIASTDLPFAPTRYRMAGEALFTALVNDRMQSSIPEVLSAMKDRNFREAFLSSVVFSHQKGPELEVQAVPVVNRAYSMLLGLGLTGDEDTPVDGQARLLELVTGNSNCLRTHQGDQSLLASLIQIARRK